MTPHFTRWQSRCVAAEYVTRKERERRRNRAINAYCGALSALSVVALAAQWWWL